MTFGWLATIWSYLHVKHGYDKGGFTLFREEWMRHDAYAGRNITLSASGRLVSGIACGVDGQGGLLLNTDSGIMTFSGGEVSLLKK